MHHVLQKIQEKIQRSLNSSGGAKYFSNVHSGEGAELLKDLRSADVGRQRDAVKRVIARMTIGRDVSYHFVDIIKLSQTEDLELKKLVYLYVLNTAKLQPGKAILAVNTFLQDVASPSPVVRGLAVRTMLCLRVPAVLGHLLEPLRGAIRDPDPYVRKTAAIGLGKVFHQSREVFAAHGLADELARLLLDGNALVASNAAAVVCEVGAAGPPADAAWAGRLLAHLPDASEWGQVYLLELLAGLEVADPGAVLARVLPRLHHASPAVVMAAVKVVARLAGRCPPEALARAAARVHTALLTLAGASDPETRYVVYKNIHALLVVFPGILRTHLDAFYVRFNDPPYLKREKLRLLLRLATPATAPAIVGELAEYAAEVDRVFLEEVVAATARLAIKIEDVAGACAELLLRALQTHPELLSAVVIAAKNVVRRYPALLLLEPLARDYGPAAILDAEAKSAFVWMLGEHGDFVEDGRAILDAYVGSILENEPAVQLSILGAAVRLFLRDPAAMQARLTAVLQTLTARSEDPDVRDRAFAYWRLLSKDIDIDKMRRILESQSPEVNVDKTFSDAMMMEDLKKSINTSAVIFGQPPQTFLPPYGLPDPDLADEDDADEDDYAADNADENKDASFASPHAEEAPSTAGPQSPRKTDTAVEESARKSCETNPNALDMLFSTPSPSPKPPSMANGGKRMVPIPPTAVKPPEKSQPANLLDDLFS